MATSGTERPPPDSKVAWWLTAVKGLTLTNALVIVILMIVAIPAYLMYKAVNDAALLDRFMSSYEEISSQNVGCAMRKAKRRGSQPIWTITTGFAYQGADKWTISVVLEHEPDTTEIVSFCETLKLIADKLVVPDIDDDSVTNE